MADDKVYVGIDVSKAWLDIALHPSQEGWRIENIQKDIRKLIKRFQSMPIEHIVVEATGGYEMGVVRVLAAHALPLAVVNPRQVRDFARATGTLARTDTIDARIIARFAEAIRPEEAPQR